jgi:hypothetical protein
MTDAPLQVRGAKIATNKLSLEEDIADLGVRFRQPYHPARFQIRGFLVDLSRQLFGAVSPKCVIPYGRRRCFMPGSELVRSPRIASRTTVPMKSAEHHLHVLIMDRSFSSAPGFTEPPRPRHRDALHAQRRAMKPRGLAISRTIDRELMKASCTSRVHSGQHSLHSSKLVQSLSETL